MKQESIMIVENNTDLRNTLRHAFEDRGYTTWTCPGPEIAVSIFFAVQPNIVILDLDFEGFDSMILLDAWRAHAPNTRVIVESTVTDSFKKRQAMERGAHAFLAKPYALSPLFELLEKDKIRGNSEPPTIGNTARAA